MKLPSSGCSRRGVLTVIPVMSRSSANRRQHSQARPDPDQARRAQIWACRAEARPASPPPTGSAATPVHHPCSTQETRRRAGPVPPKSTSWSRATPRRPTPRWGEAVGPPSPAPAGQGPGTGHRRRREGGEEGGDGRRETAARLGRRGGGAGREMLGSGREVGPFPFLSPRINCSSCKSPSYLSIITIYRYVVVEKKHIMRCS